MRTATLKVINGIVISPWATKLATPANLSWDNETPAKACWDAVANASSYTVRLYKGETAIGSPVTGITWTSFDFTSAITENGTYTFTVQAIGDGAYFDSDVSLKSPGYTVPPPAINPAVVSFDLNAPADITARYPDPTRMLQNLLRIPQIKTITRSL